VSSSSSGTVTASEPASAPTLAPTPDPNAPQTVEGSQWKGYVTFDDQGNLKIFNPLTETYNGEVCYFQNVEHPQPLLFSREVSIPSGATKTFDSPGKVALFAALKEKGQVNEEEEVCELSIQADAGFKSFSCDRPSNQLADAGSDHLHNYKYFTLNRDPGEWVWGAETRTAETEWSKCITRDDLVDTPNADILPQTPAEGCFKWRSVTMTKIASRSCSVGTQSESRTFIEYERCDCPVVCKEWYPGSLPEEGRGRITFMSKLPDGRYLWRVQNNTGFDNVTLSGPGLDETLFVQSGTIAAHITDQPYYGVSLNLCDGTRIHGTASANENVETWCEVPQAPPGECPLGLCFYEIRGAEEGTEGEVCEDAQGNWMRWGPSEKVQCVLDVPGILRSDFRLTPGQSDPACLKYTGR
jgi:hypothetical protein